jgi:signal transduction histidine kinase
VTRYRRDRGEQGRHGRRDEHGHGAEDEPDRYERYGERERERYERLEQRIRERVERHERFMRERAERYAERHVERALRHRQRQRARRRRGPLQRQLFFSFGFAILIAMGVSAWVSSWLGARPLGRGLAYAAAAMFVWGLAGSWARRLLMPLRELTRASSELGAGKLDSRVRMPGHVTSEFQALGAAFNEMATRIEAHVKSKNEVLHLVSHELRTPLARLRVLLGILSESNTHPKLSDDLEREVLELDQLVGELLASARIDAGSLQKRELDVETTVHTCLERAFAEDVKVHVESTARDASADPTLLSRALIVLLDNAKKHGGGARLLRVERRAEHLRFTVEDAGPGFADKDLERLFTPFARGESSGGEAEAGLGLGLYLVRRIAEAHGGEAFAHNLSGGGGARVGFTLHSPQNAA